MGTGEREWESKVEQLAYMLWKALKKMANRSIEPNQAPKTREEEEKARLTNFVSIHYNVSRQDRTNLKFME